MRPIKIGDRDTFAPKLARENGWSVTHTAVAAIEEYRRFCFLAATGDRPVTPSDAVDRVWHLHLTYTRDYWERFCPDVLGRAFHHDPGGAGAAERHRHFAQYADTLARYEAAFGDRPAGRPLAERCAAARRPRAATHRRAVPVEAVGIRL